MFLFFSVFLCVAGQIKRRRESLVLYKSFKSINTLCPAPFTHITHRPPSPLKHVGGGRVREGHGGGVLWVLLCAIRAQ
jgi:hypothetical protein